VRPRRLCPRGRGGPLEHSQSRDPAVRPDGHLIAFTVSERTWSVVLAADFRSALIAARIRAARDAGCRLLVVETFDEPAGTHNSSYHNLVRAGFTLRYSRQNWVWRNPETLSA
jgi:hypothetical protein